jgi:hypothetical protein
MKMLSERAKGGETEVCIVLLFYRILDAKQPFPKQENIMGDL